MKKLIIILLFSFVMLTTSFSQSWDLFTTENSDLPINSINNLVLDSNDNLWFHTTNSIYMYNQTENKWKEFNQNNSNLISGFTHISIGKDGSVYVSSNHIFKFKENVMNFEIVEENIKCDKFIFDENGVLYYVIQVNVYSKEGVEVKEIYNGQVNGPHYPSDLKIDNSNVLWFGTFGFPNGVYSYNDGNLNVYNNIKYDIPNFTTVDLSIDSFNNVWFLSDVDLITYKFESANDIWTTYDSTNSILGEQYSYNSKNIQTRDKLWLTSTVLSGVSPRKLLSFNYNQWSEYNIDLALNLDTNKPFYLNALAIDSKNNVWIGTSEGLIKFNETTTSVETNEKDLVSIYPNPASNQLTIDLQGKQATSYTISDIKGNIIENKHGNYSSLMYLNLKSFPIGTYIIELTLANNQRINNKFVKE